MRVRDVGEELKMDGGRLEMAINIGRRTYNYVSAQSMLLKINSKSLERNACDGSISIYQINRVRSYWLQMHKAAQI